MSLLTGLTSYWKADESSGNLADSIGSNTLTSTGVTFGAGKINNGAIIGSGNYAQAGDVFDFAKTDDWSVSLWANRTTLSAGANQMLVSKGTNQWNLYFNTTDHLSAAVPGVANIVSSTNATSTTGTWFHLVLTHTGAASNDTWALYKNNVQDGSATSSAAMAGNALNFTFGAEAGSPPTLSLKGNMDEVGLWTRVLTTDEISQLYNSGNGLALGSFPSGGPATGFLSTLGVGN